MATKTKKKVIIVVNGKPGVGKTTLCNRMTDNEYMYVSSIDPVKALVEESGMVAEKDIIKKTKRYRKLLADMKQALIAYNDTPLRYCAKAVNQFYKLKKKNVLFVDIREPEEIDKFRTVIEILGKNVPVVTLHVKAGGIRVARKLGIASDDNTEDYMYDYLFINSFEEPIEESREKFDEFIEEIRNDVTGAE